MTGSSKDAFVSVIDRTKICCSKSTSASLRMMEMALVLWSLLKHPLSLIDQVQTLLMPGILPIKLCADSVKSDVFYLCDGQWRSGDWQSVGVNTVTRRQNSTVRVCSLQIVIYRAVWCRQWLGVGDSCLLARHWMT